MTNFSDRVMIEVTLDDETPFTIALSNIQAFVPKGITRRKTKCAITLKIPTHWNSQVIYVRETYDEVKARIAQAEKDADSIRALVELMYSIVDRFKGFRAMLSTTRQFVDALEKLSETDKKDQQ